MVWRALKTVFKNKFYLLFCLVVALLILVFFTWLPNIKLILIILDSSVSMFEKATSIFSLTGSIKTNFTLFSASYTFIIAILFAVNLTMLIFLIKRKGVFLKSNGISTFGGFISGIFGVGCVSCGSVILAPLLSVFGFSGLLFYLPFGGQEFGIFAVFILAVMIFFNSKSINKISVCTVK